MTTDIKKGKFVHSGPVKYTINFIMFLLYTVVSFFIVSFIVLNMYPIVDDVAEKQGGIIFMVLLLLMVLTVVFKRFFYITNASVGRVQNNEKLQSRKGLIDKDLFGKSTIVFFSVYIISILLNVQFGQYIAMICSISVYTYLFYKRYDL